MNIIVEKIGDFFEVHDWDSNETIFVSKDYESCRKFVDELKRSMTDDDSDGDEDIAVQWLTFSEVMNPEKYSY